jgi:rod shape-determining protein MreD
MRFEQWLALVRTRVVLFTLAVAWALSFLTVRQTAWLDWMALVLLFWTVYQPKRISLLVAFVLGIVVDVQQASRMGEHALMYVWLVYGMRLLAPRLQFASVFVHALYATAMVFAIQLLRALLYLVLLGSQTKLSLMLWLLLAIPAWLLLAMLLTRGAQSRKMGQWMAN